MRVSTALLVSTIVLGSAVLSGCGDSSGPTLPLADSEPGMLSENEQFLANNAARSGVMVTESGLQYEIVQEAQGVRPSASDIVTVHYEGSLIDGTVFDSSIARNAPATFPLSGTIDGWVEGVQLMPVGSIYRFVIPPELAYGDQGAGTLIPPDAVLIFVVQLIEING